ncbi:hypothetical protein ACOSQ3_027542 [Xanthoceras sorbifolium]
MFPQYHLMSSSPDVTRISYPIPAVAPSITPSALNLVVNLQNANSIAASPVLAPNVTVCMIVVLCIIHESSIPLMEFTFRMFRTCSVDKHVNTSAWISFGLIPRLIGSKSNPPSMVYSFL